MFHVFTTAAIIDRFVESFGNHECDWLDILSLQTDIYYSGRSDNWEEDPEDPWFIVSQAGPDFIDNSDYIDAIKEHPERVLEHPDSAFILDIDEDTAKHIEQDYGVICLPASKVNSLCKVSKREQTWILCTGDSSDSDQPIRHNWGDILGKDMCRYPSNAMIMVDRNFFGEYNKYTNEFVCVEGLKDLLNTVSPKSLKCEYQVLIVYEQGLHYIQRNVNLESEEDFISYNEKHIADYLANIREYPILVKLLAVAPSRGIKDEDYKSHKDLFNRTHNRRSVTNYYILKADYSLAPFYNTGRVRAEQDIHQEFIYSSFQERQVCDLAIRGKKRIVELVQDLLSGNPSFYSCQKPVDNRLINIDSQVSSIGAAQG